MNLSQIARLIAVAGLAVAVVLAVACGGRSGEATRYHCPMHPTYISDQPGDCPICGMRLVPIEKTGDSAQGTGDSSPSHPPDKAVGHVHTEGYVCTMCPEVHERAPGRCRVCGMKLVPAATTEHRHADHDHAGDAAALPWRPVGEAVDSLPTTAGSSAHPPGLAPVEVAPEAARLAGVQTAPVERASLGRATRTVGTVTADETRVRHVHTKVSGWVERLHVSYIGQPVRRGQPVLEIYSPELLASQDEFLRAREVSARFAASELPEVRRGGEELLAAARRRLELFDVPEAFIAELERTGSPRRTVTLLAPVSGYVTAKNVVEGHEVQPGGELFTITDLSRVWVEADFYEYEAASLRLGESAIVTLAYDPGVRLAGRIAFIAPTLDPASRTLRVRFEFDNPGLRLKPGMFANVELTSTRSAALVIPDSAVIDTGERQVVFVATSPGRFEPREVTIGVRAEGRAEVLAGLAAGEQVVTRANFLLDSESRMRAAFTAATAGSGASTPPPPAHEH
ncbi:MAG: efflux transporter, family, subunit [Acidobacteria bacterium]|nr:efflux transporter, family, subunit [Acidobacteriota bacterium]